jgi:methylase of polypeptide subunit release factors
MSQRDSGYERKERDLYETPEWVTWALLPHLPDGIGEIWEPACGSGKMVRALAPACPRVRSTDIESGTDFLAQREGHTDWIITNPPYVLATEFIEHAFTLGDHIAMLLRTDFDHAATRAYLFGDCPAFEKKIVLTKRIRWFEDSKGSPSFNHAWFIWSHNHKGPPTLAYGP